MKCFIRKNDQGFSLVELIVVVLIIGVLATAAGLAFSLVYNADAERAAKRLSSLVSVARTQAMAIDSGDGNVYVELKVFNYDGDNYAAVYKCEETHTNIGGVPVTNKTWTLIEPNEARSDNPLVPTTKLANYGVSLEAGHKGTKLFDIDATQALSFKFKKSTGGLTCTTKIAPDGAASLAESQAYGTPQIDEDTSGFCTEVVLKGSETYTVIIVPATGKAFIK